MPRRYYYSLVENTYVARRTSNSCERLTHEGEWVRHKDIWDVITNGRPLKNEEEALQQGERLRKWFKRWAEEQEALSD